MASRSLRNIAIVIAGLLLTSSPAFAYPNINIPRLHLKSSVNYSTPDRGPYLYYQDNNTVAIAGHRVTPWVAHGWPHGAFWGIDTVRVGDLVYLTSRNYVNVYRVRAIFPAVRPSAVREFTKLPGLILSACTPKYSASYRYVVRATLVNVIHR